MQLSTPLTTPLLSTIETAMNTWLKLDSEAMPQFSSMQDKIIRLHVTGLEINLYFFPGTDHVQVLSGYEGQADTTIHGSPFTLMKLGTTDDAGKLMLETDAYIDGDTGLGTRFSQILGSVEIDWEEFLSRVVGDVLAHQAGSVVASSKGWLQDSGQAMTKNIAEYMTEEQAILVADAEVSQYLDQVDELRSDMDRMQMRVERLRSRLDQSVIKTSKPHLKSPQPPHSPNDDKQ